jgi:ParB/RepB/Spo0J family partition protein
MDDEDTGYDRIETVGEHSRGGGGERENRGGGGSGLGGKKTNNKPRFADADTNNKVGANLMKTLDGIDQNVLDAKRKEAQWKNRYLYDLNTKGFFKINSRQELPRLFFGTIAQIPLSFLRRYEDQPRIFFNPKKLAALSASIKLKGDVNKPIDIIIRQDEQGEFYCLIIGGERRCIASKNAGLTHVSCLIHTPIDNDADLYQESVVDNMGKEPLEPIEESLAVKKFQEYGLSDEQIAVRLAKSVQTIQQIKRYRDLLPGFIKKLHTHELTKGEALILVKWGEHDQQAIYEIIQKLQKENQKKSIHPNDLDLLVRRQAEEMGLERAPRIKKGSGRQPEATADLIVKKIERGTKTFKTLLKLLKKLTQSEVSTNIMNIISTLDEAKKEIEEVLETLNGWS